MPRDMDVFFLSFFSSFDFLEIVYLFHRLEMYNIFLHLHIHIAYCIFYLCLKILMRIVNIWFLEYIDGCISQETS